MSSNTRGMYFTVCHTPGCENENIPIKSPWDSADPTWIVICAPCNGRITDLTPATRGFEIEEVPA